MLGQYNDPIYFHGLGSPHLLSWSGVTHPIYLYDLVSLTPSTFMIWCHSPYLLSRSGVTHPIYFHDLEPLCDICRVCWQTWAARYKSHKEYALIVAECFHDLPKPADQVMIFLHFSVPATGILLSCQVTFRIELLGWKRSGACCTDLTTFLRTCTETSGMPHTICSRCSGVSNDRRGTGTIQDIPCLTADTCKQISPCCCSHNTLHLQCYHASSCN